MASDAAVELTRTRFAAGDAPKVPAPQLSQMASCSGCTAECRGGTCQSTMGPGRRATSRWPAARKTRRPTSQSRTRTDGRHAVENSLLLPSARRCVAQDRVELIGSRGHLGVGNPAHPHRPSLTSGLAVLGMPSSSGLTRRHQPEPQTGRHRLTQEPQERSPSGPLPRWFDGWQIHATSCLVAAPSPGDLDTASAAAGNVGPVGLK